MPFWVRYMLLIIDEGKLSSLKKKEILVLEKNSPFIDVHRNSQFFFFPFHPIYLLSKGVIPFSIKSQQGLRWVYPSTPAITKPHYSSKNR